MDAQEIHEERRLVSFIRESLIEARSRRIGIYIHISEKKISTRQRRRGKRGEKEARVRALLFYEYIYTHLSLMENLQSYMHIRIFTHTRIVRLCASLSLEKLMDMRMCVRMHVHGGAGFLFFPFFCLFFELFFGTLCSAESRRARERGSLEPPLAALCN